jgi:hypothetical protein
MICIFCDEENNAKSIEHIVSESLGNQKYVLPKGMVCDDCNSKFSKFEDKALTKTVLAVERARFAVKTKKKKNVKGKIEKLEIEGDENFRKSFLNIKGVKPRDLRNFDSIKGTGELVVPSFDKSEVATSKLLLKIGLESLYISRRKIFKKYILKDLKDFITTKVNEDWPFLTTDYEPEKFTTVPRFIDRYLLKKNHCEIKFLEIDKENLLLKFTYGGINMCINLINRNLDWTERFLKNDPCARLYPERHRKKAYKNEVKESE